MKQKIGPNNWLIDQYVLVLAKDGQHKEALDLLISYDSVSKKAKVFAETYNCLTELLEIYFQKYN